MKETYIPLTAAVLRQAFPNECTAISENTLYNLLSADVQLTKPKGGEYLQTHAIELLRLAAPFVPLVVQLIKALKPTEREHPPEVVVKIVNQMATTREAERLKNIDPNAMEHIVQQSTTTILKNWDKVERL